MPFSEKSRVDFAPATLQEVVDDIAGFLRPVARTIFSGAGFTSHWREMIVHGETGFLGDGDEELAHFAAMLAYDEPLRMRIVHAARQRLVDELANPDVLCERWRALFASLDGRVESLPMVSSA